MPDYQECYIRIIENRFFDHISGIFTTIQCYLAENRVYDIEKSKKWFIKILEMFLNNREVIIVFDARVVGQEKKQELDNADIKTQLDFIYNSFPTEYDENIMEKDINNLWWHCCCPVEVGWLQEDGNYWFG